MLTFLECCVFAWFAVRAYQNTNSVFEMMNPPNDPALLLYRDRLIMSCRMLKERGAVNMQFWVLVIAALISAFLDLWICAAANALSAFAVWFGYAYMRSCEIKTEGFEENFRLFNEAK